MAWKGVHLTRPARLSLANRQIVIAQDDGEVRLPIEDVAWIILDTQQVSVTGVVLSACMEAGIVIVVCDGKHTPCGVSLPFHTHHRQSGVAEAQIGMTEPMKKRLWRSIVQVKIQNQASVLARKSPGAASSLQEMTRWVRSGDPDNVEARAARHYWSNLFENFVRSDDGDRRNKLLNYGYAIVRSAVARTLVASGFLPAFGLNHASVSNAFNLADDLVEPFRPFVDRMAMELAGPESTWRDELTIEDRRALAAVLLANAKVGEATVSLLAASEIAAASLARAIQERSAALLQLPVVADDERGGPDED